MTSESTKPIAKFGKELRVTVWRARNGSCCFSIEKQYKDKNTNEWKKSNTWFLRDIEALKPLLEEAIKFGQIDAEEKKSWERPASEDY